MDSDHQHVTEVADPMTDSRPVLRILVADDSELQLQFEQALLAGAAYDLIVARNGAETIARARRYLPDLILLDVVMPVINGIEVARYLRQDPATAHIPIIMVTSRIELIHAENARDEKGYNDYLAKPVIRDELLAKIRNLIPPGAAGVLRPS